MQSELEVRASRSSVEVEDINCLFVLVSVVAYTWLLLRLVSAVSLEKTERHVRYVTLRYVIGA